MLRNLVKKFKSQSLNEGAEADGDDVHPESTLEGKTGDSSSEDNGVEATSRPHRGGMDARTGEHDSGTESDEELQKIETTSVVSMPVSVTSDYAASASDTSSLLSAPLRPAPPLGRSDDQDCNSWDSMGCESGIVGEDEEEELPSPPLPTPSQLLYSANSRRLLLKAGPSLSSGARGREGAFRPVQPRCAEAAALATQLRNSSLCRDDGDSLGSSGGAKRRWDSGTGSNSSDLPADFPTLADLPTDFSGLLQRRTPLRLLVAPPAQRSHTHFASLHSPKEEEATQVRTGSVSPRKKSRSDVVSPGPSVAGRPSLNFDKMREKMVKPKRGGLSSAKARLKSSGYQLRSWRKAGRGAEADDCVFRPLEPPSPGQAEDESKTPTPS